VACSRVNCTFTFTLQIEWESIPVRLAKTWLACNGRIWECVHSSRVESSPTTLAGQVLTPLASYSSIGLQCWGVTSAILLWEMNAERLVLLVQARQAKYDASDGECRSRLDSRCCGYKLRRRWAIYAEFQSLHFYWTLPHVSYLLTQTPSTHNCVQKKEVKVCHRCRFLYLCTVQGGPNHVGLARVSLEKTRSVFIPPDFRV
jgi:hypothetical protein